MTPQEKAFKLYSTFLNIVDLDVGILPKKATHLKAKLAALRAVDEIIKELIVTDYAKRFKYWQDVKAEIEKF